MKKTFCLVCAALLLCAASAGAAVVPVRVARVDDAGSGELRHYFGTVQGSQRVNLSFRVPGPLVELPVEAGTRVKKGDLIARIDPRDFRTRLADAQSRLSQARAHYTKAQSDYRRFEELYKKNVVPQSQFDSFRTAFDVARSSLRTAEAGVATARNALADTELRAPFGGVVVARMAENYQDVQPMQPIVSLQNLDTVEIVVGVPEEDVANIHAGDDKLRSLGSPKEISVDLNVTLDSLPGRSFTARFKEIGTQSNPRTRTYPATVVMPQPSDARVLPGMSVQVTARVPGGAQEKTAGLIVPLEALVGDVSEHIWVWRLREGGNVERVPVTPLEFRGEAVLVTGGLTSADTVVTTGARELDGSSLVRVVD